MFKHCRFKCLNIVKGWREVPARTPVSFLFCELNFFSDKLVAGHKFGVSPVIVLVQVKPCHF